MKLTRNALRGLILEQMGMMGMGQQDPELVKQLQPFLDKMLQNPDPDAYAIALEEFEDGSAYDPMGASMNSTLQMVKMLAKKAGDTEMIQLVDNAVLPDGRTFLQTSQENEAERVADIAASVDPTGMADPYAAAPADPTAMDDPFPMSMNEGAWKASRWQELSGLLTEGVD